MRRPRLRNPPRVGSTGLSHQVQTGAFCHKALVLTCLAIVVTLTAPTQLVRVRGALSRFTLIRQQVRDLGATNGAVVLEVQNRVTSLRLPHRELRRTHIVIASTHVVPPAQIDTSSLLGLDRWTRQQVGFRATSPRLNEIAAKIGETIAAENALRQRGLAGPFTALQGREDVFSRDADELWIRAGLSTYEALWTRPLHHPVWLHGSVDTIDIRVNGMEALGLPAREDLPSQFPGLWHQVNSLDFGEAYSRLQEELIKADVPAKLSVADVARDQLGTVGICVILSWHALLLMLVRRIARRLRRWGDDIAGGWIYVYEGPIALLANVVSLFLLPLAVCVAVWRQTEPKPHIAAILATVSCVVLATAVQYQHLRVAGLIDRSRKRGRAVRFETSQRAPVSTSSPREQPTHWAPKPATLMVGDSEVWMTRAEAEEEASRRWGSFAVVRSDYKGDSTSGRDRLLYYVGVRNPNGDVETLGVGSSWAGAFVSADRKS